MKIYLDVQRATDKYKLAPDLLWQLAEERKIRAGLFEDISFCSWKAT